jgi:HSP20 family protein
MLGAMMKPKPAKLEKQEATPSRVEDSSGSLRTYTPRVDIHESAEALTVIADMPGVDDSSVDITLDRGVLTIRGNVVHETPNGFSAIYREYEPGNFERSFTMPEAIDRDAVSAVVTNGVVRVTLPKAKSAKPRRIEVKAG